MITTVDVNKLECVYIKKVSESVLQSSYGVDCKATEIENLIKEIEGYLILLDQNLMICKSLECKILSIIDKYFTGTFCVRDLTRFNIR